MNGLVSFGGAGRPIDPALAVSLGNLPGITHVNKFGRNPDIDKDNDPQDIWDGGGNWVGPSGNDYHEFSSSSSQDQGIVRASGNATGGSLTTLIDAGASFLSDGITAEDTVLNDTNQDHSVVVTVDSDTQLTIRHMHHNNPWASGQGYRIVSPSGTGAAVLHLKRGWTVDGESQSEFVVLAGTNPVRTANQYYRIDRAHVHGCGISNVNVGSISGVSQTYSTKTIQINPSNGQTQMAIAYVPKGKVGYITNLSVALLRGGGSANAEVAMRFRLWGDRSEGFNVKFITHVLTGQHFIKYFNPYILVESDTDIIMRCESVSANNSDIVATFDMIIVDKEVAY